MLALALALILSLLVILAAAELFTNALEHLGERLHISDGVTGSLFAAIGTALPETLVPLLALVSGTPNSSVNEEIGVGAILGAPLMLSTLTAFLLFLAVVRQRGLHGHVEPEISGFRRELNYFIAAFFVSAAAMYIPHSQMLIRAFLSAALVCIYLMYVVQTVRASRELVSTGHGTTAEGKMLFTRIGFPLNTAVIVLQLAVALILLVCGAKGFIYGVEGVSHVLGISPLLLSLLIIPVATELPEKINSVIWVRRKKDTLAVGNITGAMVFQGTLLPALGILLTPWAPRTEVLAGIIVTLIAATWLRINATSKGIPVWALTFNGLLYAGYLFVSLKH